MTHPVLTDSDFTVAITLTHDDGTTTTTTGQQIRSPEREDQAEAPGRLALHCPTPENDAIVESIAVGTVHYDVLESDPVASGLASPAFADWDSTVYIVRRSGIAVAARDFDPLDFDELDFA